MIRPLPRHAHGVLVDTEIEDAHPGRAGFLGDGNLMAFSLGGHLLISTHLACDKAGREGKSSNTGMGLIYTRAKLW